MIRFTTREMKLVVFFHNFLRRTGLAMFNQMRYKRLRMRRQRAINMLFIKELLLLFFFPILFLPQCYYRIQIAGFDGRSNAKDQAHSHRDQ